MDLIRKDMPNKYLLCVDVFSIVISFLLSAWIIYGGITNLWFNNNYGVAFASIIFLYIAIYYLYDSYGTLFKRGFLEEMLVVIKINTILAVTLTVVMFIAQEGTTYSRVFFFLFLLLNILITYVVRQYYKVLLLAVYKKSKSSYKVMIITTSDQISNVLERFQYENEWEYQVTYLTILDKYLVGQKFHGIEVKADFLNMFDVAKQEVLDGVFIHIPSSYPLNFNLEEIVLEFQNMGVTVDLSINTFGLRIDEKIVRKISGYHVITFSNRIFNESQMLLKRIVDISGGLVGCLITALCFLLIAPAIRIESKGPIFFKQVRIGKNGRRFWIYKFRSMYMDAEERLADLMKHNEMKGLMFKMKDDPRITKVGNLLRRTSLDELPQFFNILKGDMSLVGTRPPTEKEFLKYEGRHKGRLALKSGLTGLWQVSGRSDITEFEDVVKMDLEYIGSWSMKLDIKIILKTIGVVLFRKGSR
jgi:exopolysaccharide biosynthesis polyprenyl glycosylphosphotransferase